MSFVPQEQEDRSTDGQVVKHVDPRAEELAQLCSSDMEFSAFCNEFLNKIESLLDAVSSSLWWAEPQGGNFVVRCQSHTEKLGVVAGQSPLKNHHGLIRDVLAGGRPLLVPYLAIGTNGVTPEALGQGQPIRFHLMLAPITVELKIVGLLEVWQVPTQNARTARGYLQPLVFAAFMFATYYRSLKLREVVRQQSAWSQIEAFAHQIHASLQPTEVAYLIANEGKRITGCDRLSIAQRAGTRTVVEAVSGADVVEKHSTQVTLMRKLFETVFLWNERLVYNGTRDDTLPPKVLAALDAFLAESNSKLLVVLPVRDERETDDSKPSRSALMLESFELTDTAPQAIGKLEVISKHAAPALYNALEHRRIPLRWLWQPLATLQEGVGGKAKAITSSVALAALILLLLLIFVPYPLKMDSHGQLLPRSRAWIFPPAEGHIVRFEIEPAATVFKDQSLVLMHDTSLELKLINLNKEIDSAEREIQASAARYSEAAENERQNISIEKQKQEHIRELKLQERDRLRERTNSEEAKPGNFWIKSPMDGLILNSDFQENLTNRFMKPSEQLLRVGNQNGEWEVELKIPQKHIGQILLAFDPKNPAQELDVDLLLLTAPTRTFKGKLARTKIAGEAVPNQDENNESEPVVSALVRISGADIDPRDRVPRNLFLTDSKVHAKVRCGDHAMGYSLFYGVWEFLYEKVVFFF